MKALVLILLSYSYGSIYASGIESAKTCIQKITKETKCKYKKNNEFKYTQGTLSREVGNRLYGSIRNVNYGFEILNDTFIRPHIDNCENCSEDPLTDVENLVLNHVHENDLTSCQAACVVKCVSKEYIDYDKSKFLRSIRTPKQIAITEKGACGDFANFSVHLLTLLGLDANIEYGLSKKSSSSHSWTSVMIDDREYWFEPQHSTCTFFEVD